MSAASTIAKAAYQAGCRAALIKLGTNAGTISYAPRNSEHNPAYDYTEEKRDDLWREFDANTTPNGEESALGMPSAGGINKTSGLEDGGYGTQEGPYGVGGVDADQGKPDRDKRLSSAMEEAFRANDEYDQSYGPESPSTQPHGGVKAAFSASTFGVGSAMKMPGLTSMPKTPNSLMKSMMPKPPKVQDPRAMTPPTMNLMQGLKPGTNTNFAANSINSVQTRPMGIPT